MFPIFFITYEKIITKFYILFFSEYYKINIFTFHEKWFIFLHNIGKDNRKILHFYIFIFLNIVKNINLRFWKKASVRKYSRVCVSLTRNLHKFIQNGSLDQNTSIFLITIVNLNDFNPQIIVFHCLVCSTNYSEQSPWLIPGGIRVLVMVFG